MATNSTTIQNTVGLTERVLGETVNVLLKTNNTLLNSGLAVTSPVVDAVAGGGSRVASLDFINPYPTDTVNISNDDITDDGEVIATTGGTFMAFRNDLNIGIGFTDLAAAVTKWDGKGAAPAMLADMWNTIQTNMAISAIVGALKVSTALTYTGASGVGLYNAAMLAGATAGVHADEFDIMIVHPLDYAQMRIDNKIPFVPASQTQSRFDEWAGFKLIKSKAFAAGQIVMARTGALAFGTGLPVPFIETEYERLANKGNGGGADILHSRRSIVVQPQGFSWKGGVAPTVLKSGSTAPALETAANWSLVVPDIEQIGFRKIVLTA
jgi:hypothetical protein